MYICPPTMLQGIREVWQIRDSCRCPIEAGHVSSCSGLANGRGPPPFLLSLFLGAQGKWLEGSTHRPG